MTRANVEAYSALVTATGATAFSGPTTWSSTSARPKTSSRSSRPIHDTHCDPGARGPPRPTEKRGRRSLRLAPRADWTIPVRTCTTRTPASAAGRAAASQASTSSARNPAPPPALLRDQLVSPLVPVEADGRRAHENPRPVGQGGHDPGERGGRADTAVAHQPLVGVGETAGDGRPGEVHDGVDALQRPRIGSFGIPGPLERMTGHPSHQADHAVPAGREVSGQGGADQARGARDRDRQELPAPLGCAAVRSQVPGELVMPVAEGLPEERPGQGRLDVVDHPGRTPVDGHERVRVAPVQRERHQFVHESVRRVVTRVLRHPTHASRQLQDRPPVGQRLRLLCNLDRLPRRQEARSAPGRSCQAKTSASGASTTLE